MDNTLSDVRQNSAAGEHFENHFMIGTSKNRQCRKVRQSEKGRDQIHWHQRVLLRHQTADCFAAGICSPMMCSAVQRPKQLLTSNVAAQSGLGSWSPYLFYLCEDYSSQLDRSQDP